MHASKIHFYQAALSSKPPGRQILSNCDVLLLKGPMDLMDFTACREPKVTDSLESNSVLLISVASVAQICWTAGTYCTMCTGIKIEVLQLRRN